MARFHRFCCPLYPQTQDSLGLFPDPNWPQLRPPTDTLMPDELVSNELEMCLFRVLGQRHLCGELGPRRNWLASATTSKALLAQTRRERTANL